MTQIDLLWYNSCRFDLAGTYFSCPYCQIWAAVLIAWTAEWA